MKVLIIYSNKFELDRPGGQGDFSRLYRYGYIIQTGHHNFKREPYQQGAI